MGSNLAPAGRQLPPSAQRHSPPADSMSDQEAPEPQTAPTTTEAGTAKVIQLPRHPRRVTEDVGSPARKTWRSDGGSVYDPAPTRPVMRSELQRETGSWPVDRGAAWQRPAAGPGSGDRDGSVVELDELRRIRSGDRAAAAGIRRVAKPRRIGTAAVSDPATREAKGDPDGADDAAPADKPTGRHRR